MVVHSSRMKKLPGPISGLVKQLVANQVNYRVSRNSSYDMEQPQLSHIEYSHHPPPRLVLAWNRLPEKVKSCSLQSFRSVLSDHYLSLYSRQCDTIDCTACNHGEELQGWIFFLQFHCYQMGPYLAPTSCSSFLGDIKELVKVSRYPIIVQFHCAQLGLYLAGNLLNNCTGLGTNRLSTPYTQHCLNTHQRHLQHTSIILQSFLQLHWLGNQ